MYKILFFADVVGKTGRRLIKDYVADLKAKYSADLVVVNGENSAGGAGMTPQTAHEIFQGGADIITTGNHVWQHKELRDYLDQNKDKVLRPHNFTSECPGRGWTVVTADSGLLVGVVNLQGRIFMSQQVDNPFKCMDDLLNNELSKCKVIFVDFHKEATSEIAAFARYVDGRVSVVVGTHTHVQTADERLLPKGTAMISDVGMCGPYDSIIGVGPEEVIEGFVTGMPARFQPVTGPGILNGVYVEVDTKSGKALSIERISIIEQS